MQCENKIVNCKNVEKRSENNLIKKKEIENISNENKKKWHKKRSDKY